MLRPVPFALLIALQAWLFSGCATTVPPAPQRPQATVSVEEKKSPGLEAARHDPVPEKYPIPEKYQKEKEPVTLPPSATEVKKEEKARDKRESREIVAAPPEQEPATALQEIHGPAADDQLLGALQKDIDKAMEQPPGERKIEFSMPVVDNDRVRYFVDYFSSRKRGFFATALARSGKYIPMMAAILREEGLPEDLVYLSLIESGFSPYAVSRARAVGPWQFIRTTGLRFGLKINHWIDERRDPVKSTRAAAAYLKELHQQFGEWLLATAAYNAGEGKVGKAVQRSRTNDFWRISRKNHLKQETRSYVPKFIAATLIARTPENYGFRDVVYEPPMQYDEVSLKGPLKLKTVAELANTSVQAIKELNPALLGEVTPPDGDFVLRLPAGTREIFSRAYEQLPDSAKIRSITHRVKKGDTLSGIARRYGGTVRELMELNNLKSHLIRVNQELIVVPAQTLKTK